MEIILIGPSGTGKNTLGKLVAEKLNLPQVSLDAIRWDYYNEIGYDEAYARDLREKHGFPALVDYWKPFEIHAVERVLADYHDCVMDFGAGHSIYEDEAHFQRAKIALAPYPHIVLILPSPDPDESIRILIERQQTLAPPADLPVIGGLIEAQVRNPSSYALAKHIYYTEGKTPEQSRDDLLALLDVNGISPSP